MNPKYDTLHTVALLVNKGVDIARITDLQTRKKATLNFLDQLELQGALGDEAHAIILDPAFTLLPGGKNHDSA